jgi:hypothetical protein
MNGADKYQMFELLGNEFTFDVDVSKLGCGLNGALYFVSMDEDGGKAKYSDNKAGAKYGTGYCDAQCPRDLKFIDGKVSFIYPRHMSEATIPCDLTFFFLEPKRPTPINGRHLPTTPTRVSASRALAALRWIYGVS